MPLKRLKISPARCVNRTVFFLIWWTNVMNDNNCWCGEKLNSPGSLICSRFQSKLLRFWRFPDWNDWLTNKKRNTRKVRSRMKAGWNLLCLRKLKYYLNSTTATTNSSNRDAIDRVYYTLDILFYTLDGMTRRWIVLHWKHIQRGI